MDMAKILVPKVSKYLNSADFFKDMISLNKEKQTKFSHRYLALALKWPVSYTADLIKGRKRFTLIRALELAKYAKLDALDTERLVQLSLADSSDAKVKDHFTDVLKSKSARKSSDYNKTSSLAEPLFDNIEVGAVHEILKWARRPLSATEIKKLLYTFKNLSVERIDKIVNILIDQKVIEIKSNKLFILKNELVLDQLEDGSDGGVKIHRQYAQNFIHFTEEPQFPGLFTSGFISLSAEHFKEVALRLLEIRNWMFTLHLESAQATDEKRPASLYQFDINLVNVLDKVEKQKY